MCNHRYLRIFQGRAPNEFFSRCMCCGQRVDFLRGTSDDGSLFLRVFVGDDEDWAAAFAKVYRLQEVAGYA